MAVQPAERSALLAGGAGDLLLPPEELKTAPQAADTNERNGPCTGAASNGVRFSGGRLRKIERASALRAECYCNKSRCYFIALAPLGADAPPRGPARPE